ncbi:CoA ester lyase [Sphingomonas sp. HDW15A]|nr:CoA ester lyase [Sphingomonas sp. HDW15A]QIK97198.1 CoA ester lyase [Sphingomonas sp. HDW15A]
MLFLPASRAGAIVRARQSAADIVVLDLEDAVRDEDKEAARDAAMAAVAGEAEPWPIPLFIRINGVGTVHHGPDLAAVLHSPVRRVLVPSVGKAAELHGVARIVGQPVAAMIETAEAVMNIREIAHEASALVVGTNDLSAELRLPAAAGRGALITALQTVVLAARAAGKPVFDGVFNRLDDAEGFAAEAREGRSFGFDGKSLIHPDQIAPCRLAFAPTPDEVARAERLVAAATGGAERFEGQMIEQMHVDAARRLLARR